MSVKVNGKTYANHIEAFDVLKIDKTRYIRRVREGLRKNGTATILKYTFTGTVPPKKVRAAAGKKKAAAPKKTTATKKSAPKKTAPKRVRAPKAKKAAAAEPAAQAAA